MAKTKKYGIRELKAEFPTDDACLGYLFDTLHTRECSCGGVYKRLSGRKQFQCSKCRFQIAPMAGTIFEKSTSPLSLWFHAIFIFSNAKSGISAKEMERQLNVTYKTAWRMLTLIRSSLKQDARKLKGKVEIDGGFFGGKGHGGKNNKNASLVHENKTKIIAAQERGGDMKAETAQTVSSITLKRFLDANVEVEGTELMTDGSNAYENTGYARKSVNHRKGVYVFGDAHVNTVENFWAHLKRSIKGTHKSVSKQHFSEYLDAFVWLRNNRHNDRARFAALLAAVVR